MKDTNSRTWVVVASTLVALSAAACNGAGTDGDPATGDADQGDNGSGESFNLRLASYQPPIAAEAEATQAWAEAIEERTDGRVTIEFFFQEGLLGGAEILQGVADGRADLGYIADAYYPGELPLTNVAGVPFVTSNPEAQGRAFIELYDTNEDFQQEFERAGVMPLIWAPVPPNAAALKEPVESLAELEGLQIRAIGYSSEAYALAGMAPIALGQGEVYEALQRGVIAATSGASFDILTDRDYEEVAPHFIDLQSGNYATTFNVINADLWASMPSDIQEVITEESSNYLEMYMGVLNSREEEACEELRSANGTITVLPDDEVEAWSEEAFPVVLDSWKQNVERSGAGADADAYFEEYTTLIEQYEAESSYEPALHRCSID